MALICTFVFDIHFRVCAIRGAPLLMEWTSGGLARSRLYLRLQRVHRDDHAGRNGGANGEDVGRAKGGPARIPGFSSGLRGYRLHTNHWPAPVGDGVLVNWRGRFAPGTDEHDHAKSRQAGTGRDTGTHAIADFRGTDRGTAAGRLSHRSRTTHDVGRLGRYSGRSCAILSTPAKARGASPRLKRAR